MVSLKERRASENLVVNLEGVGHADVDLAFRGRVAPLDGADDVVPHQHILMGLGRCSQSRLTKLTLRDPNAEDADERSAGAFDRRTGWPESVTPPS